MILNFVVWDVNPNIFSIPDDIPLIGGFAIRWYGFLFAMGFVVGFFIMKRIFRHENIPYKVLDELSTYMIVSSIVGSRLGHCFFYDPQYFLANPIDILKVWEGGLASHGGAVGILVGLYFFSRKSKKPFIWILDRIVIVAALGGFFIRSGNLMNSEIFGDVTTLPWGFYFLRCFDSSYATDPRHPTQIYEALSYFLVFLFLLNYYWRKNGSPRPGMLFGLFLVLVFSVRFIIEFIKVPQVGFEEGLFLNMGQLLSIPLILLGVGSMLWTRKGSNIK